MFAGQFWILLSISIILCVIIMFFVSKSMILPVWKRFALLLGAIIAGYFGMNFLSWVESGDFMGRSLFGAHFLAPLGTLIVALILRVSTDDYCRFADIEAPCLSACVFVMKINCCLSGCCFGRVLWTAADGTPVRFPSQIAESALALAVFFYLLIVFRKGKYRGTLMWRYYIIYGVIRFFMNLLRETTPFLGILPAGNLWSLISIAVGFFFIYVHYLRTQAKNSKHKVIHSHSGRR